MTRSSVALFCILAACTEITNLVPFDAATEDGGDDGGGSEPLDAEQSPIVAMLDAGDLTDHSVEAGEGGVAFCGNMPCACSNGQDDDLDGDEDGFDGECTGPYDDDESSFDTGEVKEGNPKCEDCFFDHTPGSGDDQCYIATSCLTTKLPSSAAGNKCNTCLPTSTCINNCLPLTPNGCDCFGCCEVIHQGMPIHFRLMDTCKLDRITNEQDCPRCELSRDCYNSCERCELCPGKTPADLPKDCAGGSGPNYSCSNGKVCTETGLGCGIGEYCLQGCCIPIPPLL